MSGLRTKGRNNAKRFSSPIQMRHPERVLLLCSRRVSATVAGALAADARLLDRRPACTEAVSHLDIAAQNGH